MVGRLKPDSPARGRRGQGPHRCAGTQVSLGIRRPQQAIFETLRPPSSGSPWGFEVEAVEGAPKVDAIESVPAGELTCHDRHDATRPVASLSLTGSLWGPSHHLFWPPMAALWRNEGTGWELAEPAGFPDELTLHRLVAGEPQLLPLSGSPRLVVLGSEVALGGGWADVVGMEPSGRPVVIEVKLARNAEARRAVVAQALAYAAHLHGLTPAELERDVLGTHLRRAGHDSLVAAIGADDQEGDFDAPAFLDELTANLAAGRVRIVFVLDEAPPALVRLVGYLEAVAEGLVIDLVTVALYSVGDSQVLVPQRVEPERVVRSDGAGPGPARAKGTLFEGADEFVASIEEAAEENRPELRRLAEWAGSLEGEGLARLFSFRGTTGRFTLLPRLPGEDAGLVTIWNDGGAYLSLWESVFRRRAPTSIATVSALSGLDPIGQGRTVRAPGQELLNALTGAYREARDPARSAG